VLRGSVEVDGSCGGAMDMFHRDNVFIDHGANSLGCGLTALSL